MTKENPYLEHLFFKLHSIKFYFSLNRKPVIWKWVQKKKRKKNVQKQILCVYEFKIQSQQSHDKLEFCALAESITRQGIFALNQTSNQF